MLEVAMMPIINEKDSQANVKNPMHDSKAARVFSQGSGHDRFVCA